MKYLLFLLAIFTHLLGNESIDLFLSKLPKQQVLALDWFFRNSMRSLSGYVLYGDKPMCIESYLKTDIDSTISEWRMAKIKVFNILKEWNLSSPQYNYLFLLRDHRDYAHMIVINRAAFLKAVQDNLLLFRYFLGRTLTPEKLLEEVTVHPEKLYENIALLGILLGYGTQNSLIVSRIETIAPLPPGIKAFPFFLPLQNEKPSLGFSSLQEEEAALLKLIKGSNSLIDDDSYCIPCFGCEPQSEETAALLRTYEQNRHTLLQIVKKENFLNELLQKIFTKTSGEVALPKIIDSSPPLFTEDYFVDLVCGEIQTEDKALRNAFIDGIKNRNWGEKNEFEIWEGDNVSAKLENCKNLVRASSLFEKISAQKNWISIIPYGVSYKVLKKGKGEASSPNIKKATFHYSCRLSNEKKSLFGTIENGDVSKIIPGIASTLIGMKKGEERMALIHPRYSYGMYVADKAMIANIQLLDFEEGDTQTPLLSTCPLEFSSSYQHQFGDPATPIPQYGFDEAQSQQELLCIYQRLFKKWQKIQHLKFYNRGIHFCDLIEKSEIPFDFEKFTEKVCSRLENNSPPPPNREKTKELISDFKGLVFEKTYEKGEAPPFASWF